MTRAELKTARLTLRPVSLEDEAAVVAALNDIAVTGWLAVVPFPYTPADFQHFLTEIAKPGGTFAIDDGEGLAGIVGIGAGKGNGRELGYWFAPRCHGLGYATEAARAIVAAALAYNQSDIVSGYFEGNARSANVLRKLGFVETGRGLRHCRALDRNRPHVDMLITLAHFTAALPIVARSARLTYRSMQATDIEALHALHSDWAVVRQLGSWPWPPEPDFTATRAKPFGGEGFVWGVFQAGALVGTFGLTNGVVGYSLAPARWGQGYGYEVALTAFDHGFKTLSLDEMTASVWDDNAASLALLRKLGDRKSVV